MKYDYTLKKIMRKEKDSENRSASGYLVAVSEEDSVIQEKILYQIVKQIFLGKRKATNVEELQKLFQAQYDLDVTEDFFEGDDYYAEYEEAKQAIAEGMIVYGGEISFSETALAELADKVWLEMEEQTEGTFRRINTFLED